MAVSVFKLNGIFTMRPKHVHFIGHYDQTNINTAINSAHVQRKMARNKNTSLLPTKKGQRAWQFYVTHFKNSSPYFSGTVRRQYAWWKVKSGNKTANINVTNYYYMPVDVCDRLCRPMLLHLNNTNTQQKYLQKVPSKSIFKNDVKHNISILIVSLNYF